MKLFKYTILLSLLVGCRDEDAIKNARAPQTNILATTSYNGWDHEGVLMTINHDNHWFVVEGKFNKGAIIHHPSCPCLKTL